MPRYRLLIAAALLGVFGLSACSDTDAAPAASPWEDFEGVRVDPSAGCLDSMEIAANEKDLEASNALIADTLSQCSNADEWLSALEIAPSALGITSAVRVGKLDLQAACNQYATTAVCLDAAARGVTWR